MRNVSESFKASCNSSVVNSQFKLFFSLSRGGDVLVELGIEDVVENSLVITSMATGASYFTVGGACTSKLTFTLTRDAVDKLTSVAALSKGMWVRVEQYNLVNASIQDENDYSNGGSYTLGTCKMGSFFIYDIKNTDYKCDVVCYDSMLEFDRNVSQAELQYMQDNTKTIDGWCDYFCERCSTTNNLLSYVRTSAIANETLEVCLSYDSSVNTFREAIEFLAMLAGGFATVTEDGELTIRTFSSESVSIGSHEGLMEGIFEKNISIISGFYTTVAGFDFSNVVSETSGYDNINIYLPENPFVRGIQSADKTKMDDIVESALYATSSFLVGTKVYACKMTYNQLPYVEIGDRISTTRVVVNSDSSVSEIVADDIVITEARYSVGVSTELRSVSVRENSSAGGKYTSTPKKTSEAEDGRIDDLINNLTRTKYVTVIKEVDMYYSAPQSGVWSELANTKTIFSQFDDVKGGLAYTDTASVDGTEITNEYYYLSGWRPLYRDLDPANALTETHDAFVDPDGEMHLDNPRLFGVAGAQGMLRVVTPEVDALMYEASKGHEIVSAELSMDFSNTVRTAELSPFVTGFEAKGGVVPGAIIPEKGNFTYSREGVNQHLVAQTATGTGSSVRELSPEELIGKSGGLLKPISLTTDIEKTLYDDHGEMVVNSYTAVTATGVQSPAYINAFFNGNFSTEKEVRQRVSGENTQVVSIDVLNKVSNDTGATVDMVLDGMFFEYSARQSGIAMEEEYYKPVRNADWRCTYEKRVKGYLEYDDESVGIVEKEPIVESISERYKTFADTIRVYADDDNSSTFPALYAYGSPYVRTTFQRLPLKSNLKVVYKVEYGGSIDGVANEIIDDTESLEELRVAVADLNKLQSATASGLLIAQDELLSLMKLHAYDVGVIKESLLSISGSISSLSDQVSSNTTRIDAIEASIILLDSRLTAIEQADVPLEITRVFLGDKTGVEFSSDLYDTESGVWYLSKAAYFWVETNKDTVIYSYYRRNEGATSWTTVDEGITENYSSMSKSTTAVREYYANVKYSESSIDTDVIKYKGVTAVGASYTVESNVNTHTITVTGKNGYVSTPVGDSKYTYKFGWGTSSAESSYQGTLQEYSTSNSITIDLTDAVFNGAASIYIHYYVTDGIDVKRGNSSKITLVTE